MDNRKRTVIWFVGAVLLFTLIFFLYQQLSNNFKPETGSGAPVYEKAMDFTLENLNGEQVSLSDFKGKPVVLNFWASWCPSCQSEMKGFQKFSTQYEQSGKIVFLMVDLTDGDRETKDIAIQFLKDHDYKINVLFDQKVAVAAEYGISSIPATYFIDAEGFIRKINVGAMDESTLGLEVTKLLTTQSGK